MGLEKVTFNFMVERGGKLAKCLLCSKPQVTSIKGLKYKPLATDTVQFAKKEIEQINKHAEELLKELKEECNVAYTEKYSPDVVKNVAKGIIKTGDEHTYSIYKCLETLYKENPEIFVLLGKEKGDVLDLYLTVSNYGKSTIEMIKNTPIQEMRKVIAETEDFYKKTINSNNTSFPDYINMLIIKKKNPATYEYLKRTFDENIIFKVKSWGEDFRTVPSNHMLETITPEQIKVMTYDVLPNIKNIGEYVASSDAFVLNDKAVRELSEDLLKSKLSVDVKLYRGEKTVGMFDSVPLDKDFETQIRTLLKLNREKAKSTKITKYTGRYGSDPCTNLYDFLSSKETLTLADAMQVAKYGDKNFVNEIVKRIKTSKIIDERFKSLSFDKGMAAGWKHTQYCDNTTILQNAIVKQGTNGGYHNGWNKQYEVIINNTPKEITFPEVVYHKDGDYFELDSVIQNV